MRTICEYFATFMLYSIIGWIMETLLYIFRDKKVVKRGFLFGPICPIYGTGAVICTFLFYGRVSNPLLIFIYGLLVCGALEYITHFLMEKLFHAVWWDYSDRRFNIKGRVYLKGLVFFGIGALLIVKVLQPMIFKFIDLFSTSVLEVICFILYTLLIIDITTTVTDLKHIENILKRIETLLVEKGQATVDSTGKTITEIKESSELLAILQKVKNESALLNRIKKKYPNFTLKKYKTIIDLINDAPQKDKERKDIKIYGTAKDESSENKATTDESNEV